MFLAHFNKSLPLQLLVATILLTGTISTLALVDHQNSTITTSTRSLDALPHRLYRRGGYIEQNENDQHAVDTNALARKISEAFESACYYGSACLFGPDR